MTNQQGVPEVERDDEDGEDGNCTHWNVSVRRRVLRGGAVSHVLQCDRCGDQVGGPIKRAQAVEIAAGLEIASFDDSLREAWRVRGVEGREAERAARLAEYQVYLASPEWRARRALVLARCGNLCEGCRGAPAEQVHHLTYANVGNEFLFELVGLCNECHERVHAPPPGR